MNRIPLVLGGVVLAGVSALVARRLRATATTPEEPLTLEQEIESEFVVEDDGWAFESANIALDKLAAGMPEIARFHARVVWISRMLAFTAPGRALYISRTLMDRPGFTEAQVAFALAHEAAHHILGHLGNRSTSSIVGARLSHFFIGAKNELAADVYALKACLAAGYARDDVMKIWNVVAHYSEDYGHVDDGDDQRSFLETLGGHPSLAKRRAALAEVL